MSPRRKGSGWKHRPAHRAFLALSAAAKRLAVDGFREGHSTASIVEAIRQKHGETIPAASLNRYREWWETTERPVIEAQERTEELLRAFAEHPTPEIEQVLRQLLMAQRLTAMTEDQRPDPVALGRLDLEERKLRLQERELALREKALEKKVAAAASAVEGELRRAKLDPGTIRKIREEVYGLIG